MRIVFATSNENKMREIREIMAGLSEEILSMAQAGVSVDVEENGATFEENALIKARAVAAICPDALILADDSGLEIDALDKAPGIYSARFMGHDTSYEIKNQALLKQLEGLPWQERRARFACAIAAVLPDGQEIVLRRDMEGFIAEEAAGEGGFGYDPIFWPEGYQISSAQLSAAEKNAISHRGKALRAMRARLEEYENTHRQ